MISIFEGESLQFMCVCVFLYKCIGFLLVCSYEISFMPDISASTVSQNRAQPSTLRNVVAFLL